MIASRRLARALTLGLALCAGSLAAADGAGDTQGDTLRVAYVGGSITEGAFSSTPETSYAGRLTAWLKTRYRQVEARNIGVGGTGSDFGAYRVDHDLAGFAPDLAVIEYTVNDAGRSRADIFASVDAIIHKLRRKNPRVKVVYASVSDTVEEQDRRAGRVPKHVQDSRSVAAFEGIPFIDLSPALWAKILSGTPASTYMADAVHPNDAGHQLYFEALRDALAAEMPLSSRPSVTGGSWSAKASSIPRGWWRDRKPRAAGETPWRSSTWTLP